MIVLDVAPGIDRVEHASTSCYLVRDETGAVLVDAGLPGARRQVADLMERRGLAWSALAAVVLTHGHFDHLGLAHEAACRHHVPIWVHHADARIVRHPYHYVPGRARALYPLTRPRSWRHLGAMTGAGALRVRGVPIPATFGDDAGALDLPGRPGVVPTPGHTDGHVALHLPERDVVLTGDALVTLDPYTGRRGPRIVARAGTHDAPTAVASLEAIAATRAGTVLPGHGELYDQGARDAARLAASAGVP